jgi:hypothetical protein
MLRVEVLIPFHSKATNKDQVKGDIIEISKEQLKDIQAVNINMVLVLGEVEKKKASVKTKATK